MGTTSKAILFGHVLPAQVEAILRTAGYATVPVPTDADMTRVRVRAVGAHGDTERLLHVFGPAISGMSYGEVYAGERTVCSIGGSGIGPEVSRVLAQAFGGYHIADEGDWETVEDWTAETGGTPVLLSAKDELRIAIQRAIPTATLAGAFEALESDPDRLAALRDAIDAYLVTVSAPTAPGV